MRQLNTNMREVDEPWNICQLPKFVIKKEKENQLRPVEGVWKLASTENMEEVLTALGTTPHVIEMVLQSETMMTIYEDIDLRWKILSETSVKARSIRGYKAKNFMMTGNKFVPKEPKPELLEDWDPRVVVTTVTFDESAGEGNERLILDQVAEKDLLHRADSRVYIESDGHNLMKQTIVVFRRGEKPVRGIKRFARYKPLQTQAGTGSEADTKTPDTKVQGSKQDKGGGGAGGLMVPTSVGRKMSCTF